MNWLARFFGLDWFVATDERLMEIEQRLDLLTKWIENIDAALWKVDQALREGPGANEQKPEIRDIKRVADSIRDQIAAAKAPFPIKAEDLK